MASALLAIDPGNVTGYAYFAVISGGIPILTTACHAQWFNGPFFSFNGAYAVIEKPQVYKVEHAKGDPNDLIDLAVKVGMLCAWYPNHELVLPRQWKGQLTKVQTWNRALEVLTPEEKSIIKGNDHNMRDAICLGLWKLGRLKLA